MFYNTDYLDYFELSKNGNQLLLVVRTPLTPEILMERQIFLIIKAEREYTSGSSATIIIELPEGNTIVYSINYN